MVGEQANAAVQRNQLPANQRDAFFTPQNYEFYGEKARQNMTKLIDHYVSVGYNKHVAEMNPNPQPEPGQPAPVNYAPPVNRVQPISPSGGSGPGMPAGPRINLNNMKAAARNYEANQGGV
jgi:hypothetical protein